MEFAPVLKLSDDMGEALRMMADIDKICDKLPGLDCGLLRRAHLPRICGGCGPRICERK